MGGEFLSYCPKDNFVGHGRREVGKKLVKRVFFHPFDRLMWKTYNFYEKSPFCYGVDPGRHDFSPFCRESVDKDRIVNYNVEYKLSLH